MSSAHPPGIKQEAGIHSNLGAGQGSRVEIISQPQNKRWRYKGEKAVSQPLEFSFKIFGVTQRKALICVSLLTEDLQQHPHHVVAPKLKDGKNGRFKDIGEKDYGCVVMKTVADGQELNVNFLAVAIIKKTAGHQNQQIQSLLDRQKKSIDPTKKGFEHANADALKKINLNRARLCLQVFIANDRDYSESLEPVYTDVFCDTAHVPELKIVEHMPQSVSAGQPDEMLLLIKRINKINMAAMTVKFHNEQLGFNENADIIKVHENAAVKVKPPSMPQHCLQAAGALGLERIMVKITIIHEGDESTTDLGVFYLPRKPEAKPNYQSLQRKRKIPQPANMAKRVAGPMSQNSPMHNTNPPTSVGTPMTGDLRAGPLPVQSYQTQPNNQMYNVQTPTSNMQGNQQNFRPGAISMQYSNTTMQSSYAPLNNTYNQTTYTEMESVESDSVKSQPFSQPSAPSEMLYNPAPLDNNTGDIPQMPYFHDLKVEALTPTSVLPPNELPAMLFDEAFDIGSEEVVQGILQYEENGRNGNGGQPPAN